MAKQSPNKNIEVELIPEHALFLKYYLGETENNRTEAYLKIRPHVSRETAMVEGSKLLKKLRPVLEAMSEEADLSVLKAMKVLRDVMYLGQKDSDRVRAAEVYFKLIGSGGYGKEGEGGQEKEAEAKSPKFSGWAPPQHLTKT